uniref:DDE-1 domain-containing protein n=1 Tax=Amphimedon queenslandica TaxID=400682 RepID=A0A1X7V2C7_AMPQE
MKDCITKVIVPYIEKIRSQLPQRHVISPQPALVIFDVFKGQIPMENNIHFVHEPPNCTDRLQPLDILVNKPCKDFMRNKFIQWYSLNVCEALENTQNLSPIIDLRLSTVMPLGAQWLKLFTTTCKPIQI